MSEFFSLLIAGIVTGSIYAVSASGLVVTYSTTGVFNFAHGAVGMVLAYLFWQLWQGWGLNVIVSLVLVLLVAAPIGGVVIERAIMRPLYGAAANISIVVSLGLLLLLYGVATAVWSPTNTYVVPEFFNGDQVSLGSINVSYEQLITVGVAVIVAVFFRIFFKATRTGIAMRGVVDDPRLARLSGAPSGRISAYAWMLGVMLAGVAAVLLSSQSMNVTVLTELVIYGYAAAVVGRLRSVPLTFLGAMILGVSYSMVVGYVPQSILTDVTEALPMGMLFIVLIVMPEARLAVGRVARMRSSAVASLNQTLIGAVGVVAAAFVLSYVFGGSLATLGGVFGLAFLALSLVPLSGWGGQVSLCQFTFAGIGALTMHWVDGGSSVLGLLAAAGLCGAFGAVLALPAVRLRGIYLALATLAFAVLMDNVFFASTAIVGSGGIVSVGRPDIFGMRFTGMRSYVILLSVVFALACIGVGAVRRGRFGRRLMALQDSPVASTAVGAGLVSTKLIVFTGSAAMAGVAGALWAGIGGSAGASEFDFLESVLLFVAITLAGSRILSGALWAGVALAALPAIADHLPSAISQDFEYLLFGVGIIAIGRNPNALGHLYTVVGDRWREHRAAPGNDAPTPAVSATEHLTREVGSVG
jgi:branched-chain amino acid transport system permease protein